MKKRGFTIGLAAVLSVLLLLLFSGPVLAAMPERPENQYVLDLAQVIDKNTEDEIISGNQALFESTGAEIVVAAVEFLDGKDIADYTYELFNLWGVGSKERNNGLLLVMAIGEENYYAQAGYGIENYFNGAKLQSLLDQYLEPDFAKEDYDAGVRKFFSAALLEFNSYYGNQTPIPSETQSSAEAPAKSGGFFSFLWKVIKVVAIVAVALVLFSTFLSIFMNTSRPRGGSSSGFWGGLLAGSILSRHRNRYRSPPPPSPPPPPRTGYGGYSPRNTGASRSTRPTSGGYRSGGSSSRGSGASRGSSSGRSSGGYSRGGASRGGGAGRR